MVELHGNRLCGASVGDSGAWAIGETGIVDLTVRQPRRPLMGSGDAQPAAFGPVIERGRLLVASDGIFKYAKGEVLAACALTGALEDAVSAVIDAVRLRNGKLQDDVAVVLCDLPERDPGRRRSV